MATEIEAGKAFITIAIRNQIAKGLSEIRSQLDNYSRNLRTVGVATGAVRAAVTGAFALAVGDALEFDRAIRTLKANADLADDQFVTLKASIRSFAQETGIAAVEVANVFTEFAKAGFKNDEIEQAGQAALRLARATGATTDVAARLIGSSIKQFGLAAKDAGRVADLMVVAANETFIGAQDIEESLQYVGPVSKQLGLTLKETLALVGALGDVGLRGSEAGTALRRISIELAANSDQLSKLLKIQISSDPRNIVDNLQAIGDSIRNLPPGEGVQKLNEAFGLLGITSAAALSNSIPNIRRLQKALEDSVDAAKRQAKAIEDGPAGAVSRLRGNIRDLGIAILDALTPAIQAVEKTLKPVLASFAEFITRNKSLVTAVAATGVALTAFGGTLVAVGSGLGLLNFSLLSIRNVFKLFATTAATQATAAATAVNAANVSMSAVVLATGATYTAATAQMGRAVAIFSGVATAEFARVATALLGVAAASQAARAFTFGPAGLIGGPSVAGAVDEITDAVLITKTQVGGLRGAIGGLIGYASRAFGQLGTVVSGAFAAFTGGTVGTIAAVGAAIVGLGVSISLASGTFDDLLTGLRSAIGSLTEFAGTFGLVGSAIGVVIGLLAKGEIERAVEVVFKTAEVIILRSLKAAQGFVENLYVAIGAMLGLTEKEVRAFTRAFQNLFSVVAIEATKDFIALGKAIYQYTVGGLKAVAAILKPIATAFRFIFRGTAQLAGIDLSSSFNLIASEADVATKELDRLLQKTDELAKAGSDGQKSSTVAERKALEDEVKQTKERVEKLLGGAGQGAGAAIGNSIGEGIDKALSSQAGTVLGSILSTLRSQLDESITAAAEARIKFATTRTQAAKQQADEAANIAVSAARAVQQAIRLVENRGSASIQAITAITARVQQANGAFQNKIDPDKTAKELQGVFAAVVAGAQSAASEAVDRAADARLAAVTPAQVRAAQEAEKAAQAAAAATKASEQAARRGNIQGAAAAARRAIELAKVAAEQLVAAKFDPAKITQAQQAFRSGLQAVEQDLRNGFLDPEQRKGFTDDLQALRTEFAEAVKAFRAGDTDALKGAGEKLRAGIVDIRKQIAEQAQANIDDARRASQQRLTELRGTIANGIKSIGGFDARNLSRQVVQPSDRQSVQALREMVLLLQQIRDQPGQRLLFR